MVPPDDWTAEKLATHMAMRLDELDKRVNHRIESLKEYFDSLRAADQAAIAAALSAADGKAAAATEAAKEAVMKAEAASEKRFEGVNEFRGTLSDQQRTLMPRSEAELRFSTQDSRLGTLEKVLAERGGERRGSKEMWVLIAGVAALAIAFWRAFTASSTP